MHEVKLAKLKHAAHAHTQKDQPKVIIQVPWPYMSTKIPQRTTNMEQKTCQHMLSYYDGFVLQMTTFHWNDYVWHKKNFD